MNGIRLMVEASDYIGNIAEADLNHVGQIGGSEVYFNERDKALVICQPDQCLVVKQ